MTTAEFRSVMRMARRTARRQWKRTILIVMLIAVPVAAAIVAAAMMRAGEVTPEEWATSDFGAAEVRIEAWGVGPEVVAWLSSTIEELDPNAVVASQRNLHGPIGGAQSGLITDVDLSSPLAAGRYAVVEGEAPDVVSEIALAELIATRMSVGVGDEVTLQLDDAPERTFRLSGIVRDPLYREALFAVLDPAGFTAVAAAQPEQHRVTMSWLVTPTDPEQFAASLQERWAAARTSFWPEPPIVERPAALESVPDEVFFQLTPEEITTLAESGRDSFELESLAIEMVSGRPQIVLADLWVESRSQRLATFSSGAESVLEQPQIFSTVVAALLLAEVALVAGAAYATGTRRRLREIGLLGANGATPGHVRAGVLGEGVIGGLLGAITGVLVALAALSLGRPIMQRFIDRLIEGSPLAWSDVIGPFVAGVAAATVAAWVPARAAAGVPTLTALQGRMPVKRPARWVPIVGVSLAGFGAFLLIVAKSAVGDGGVLQAALGVLLMIGGVALLTGPLVAQVGQVADRLPATLRLVVRDAARQRTRAAAAISALLVVLIAPVVIGMAMESSDASSRIHGLAPPDDHVVVLGDASSPDELGTATTETVDVIARIIPEAASALFGTYDAQVRFAGELEAERVVGAGAANLVSEQSADSFGPYIPAGRAAAATPALLDVLDHAEVRSLVAAGTPVVLGVDSGPTYVEIDGARVDAHEVPLAVSWGMPRLLLPESVAAGLGLEPAGAKALFVLPTTITEAQQNELWNSNLAVAVPFASGLDNGQALLIALGATLVVVLGIIGLVTALAATESDRDIRTIVAVGAPPSIRRRFLGLQTTYYTLAAAVLAAPLAWLLMKASAQTQRWTDIGPFGWATSGAVLVPWDVVGVVVIGMPIVVGVATALLSRSLPSALPRRVT